MTATVTPDRLSIQYIDANNQLTERTLFMSFGLLQKLLALMPDPQLVLAADLEPSFMGKILNEVFAPRRPAGAPLDPAYQHPDLSVEAAEQVLEWVKGHVLGFFMRRIKHTKGLWDANQADLEAIASSPTGTKS